MMIPDSLGEVLVKRQKEAKRHQNPSSSDIDPTVAGSGDSFSFSLSLMVQSMGSGDKRVRPGWGSVALDTSCGLFGKNLYPHGLSSDCEIGVMVNTS